MSGDDGTFAFEGLEPGTHKVDAIGEGHLQDLGARNDFESGNFDLSKLIGDVMKWTISDRVVVREGEVSEMKMVFEAPEDEIIDALVAVTGDVRLGGSALQTGIAMLFQPGSTIQRYMATVTQGSFDFGRIRPGTYRLQVTAGLLSGSVGEPKIVRVPEQESHRIEVDLPGGGISGTVLHDDGRPASGVVLSVSSPTVSGAAMERVDIGEGTAMSGGDGSFSFQGLATGSYDIFAKELMLAGGAGQSGRLSGISIGAGEVRDDLVIHLGAGGRLHVAVRDSIGPRGNALVTLLGPSGGPLDLFHRSLTDRDGEIEFQGLPEGQYRVSVDAPRTAPGISPPVFVGEGASADVVVTLDSGVPVTLKLEGEVPDSARGQLVIYSVWRPDGALMRSGRVVIPHRDELGRGGCAEWHVGWELRAGLLPSARRGTEHRHLRGRTRGSARRWRDLADPGAAEYPLRAGLRTRESGRSAGTGSRDRFRLAYGLPMVVHAVRYLR